MIVAVDMCVQRLTRLPGGEEGFEEFPYDDATDERVRAPKGNLTVAFGFNLDAGVPRALGIVICEWEVTQVYNAILAKPWYTVANDARRSVFLDIGFNEGIDGLVNGFPHMLAYATTEDWIGASTECAVNSSEPQGVRNRYSDLAEILRTGVDTLYRS